MSGNRARYLDAAARLGRRLCRDAIWWEGRCNWMGWMMEPHGGQWISVHRAMSSLVYDGTAGIGLFLARLSPYEDDPILRATAKGALAQALTSVDSLSEMGEFGFYSGLSGIAWSCIEAGAAMKCEALVERGHAVLNRAAGLPPKDQRLDVINGSAGLIPLLLAFAGDDRRGRFLESAERHAGNLMRLASRTGQGWSWDTLGMPNERHLLGFAHGASGIAYALATLGSVIGRQDLFAAAKEALRYERGHFRAAEGNWPDLRSFAQPGPTGEPPCMLAWCHGAPGIGLARLGLHALMPDQPELLAEAETAIRTTSASLGHAALGMGNFSLCHGDAGNADLLLMGSDVLGRPELREVAEAAADRALDRFEDAGTPWPCGVMDAGETPSLLLGLAGIGHFFLRLNDPVQVPTVLLPGSLSITSAKGKPKVRRRSSGARQRLPKKRAARRAL
jgi:lantibiotic modifying enzyme